MKHLVAIAATGLLAGCSMSQIQFEGKCVDEDMGVFNITMYRRTICYLPRQLATQEQLNEYFTFSLPDIKYGTISDPPWEDSSAGRPGDVEADPGVQQEILDQ